MKYLCVFLFDRNVADGEREIKPKVNTGYEDERVNGQSYPSQTPVVTFKSANPSGTPGIAINDSSVSKVRFNFTSVYIFFSLDSERYL